MRHRARSTIGEKYPESDQVAVSFTEVVQGMYSKGEIVLHLSSVVDKPTTPGWNPTGCVETQPVYPGTDFPIPGEAWTCDCPPGQIIVDGACIPASSYTGPYQVPYAAIQFWRSKNWNSTATDFSDMPGVLDAARSANQLWTVMGEGFGAVFLRDYLPFVDFTIPWASIPWAWLVSSAKDVNWKLVNGAITATKLLAGLQNNTSDFSAVAMGAGVNDDNVFDWDTMDWSGNIPGTDTPWQSVWSLFDPNDDNLSRIPWWSIPWASPGFNDLLMQTMTPQEVIDLIRNTLRSRLGVTDNGQHPAFPSQADGAPCVGSTGVGKMLGGKCVVPNNAGQSTAPADPITGIDLTGLGSVTDPLLPGLEAGLATAQDKKKCEEKKGTWASGKCSNTAVEIQCKKDQGTYQPATDSCKPKNEQGPAGPEEPAGSSSALLIVGGLGLAATIAYFAMRGKKR